MKAISFQILFSIISLFITSSIWGQHNWKLSKNNDGIVVYQSPVPNSPYKSIKVECTLEGNYDKLISIITNVGRYHDWVYNNKATQLLKNVSAYEFYYYSETSLPWPMSNRDIVMHTVIEKDSLNRFLKIISINHNGLVTEKSGKVRVQRSEINWLVTMPSANSLHIVYTFQADPGGSIPAWIVNSFADKGPFESFKKLGQLMKQ